MLIFALAHYAWGATGTVEVRRLGLSKVGQNTLLTVVLDRPATPQISSQAVAGQPQLLVEFSHARAGLLPVHLEGDESLVRQVVTSSADGQVRIVLDLFPDKPYVYWKKTQQGSAGQTFFILGLKPDLKAQPLQSRLAAPAAPVPARPAALPPAPKVEIPETEPTPEPPQPSDNEYGYREPQANAAPGSYAELVRLMPKAAKLLQGLQANGWFVSETHRYDRPGRRLSRDFIITNNRYPELSVKVAYLPANVPGTPNIDIIMLTTDNLQSEAATKYRDLRQWSFAKIKKRYEDIGDFFDDALKPLRVKLRKETQALTLRDATVFQNFLKLACTNNPQVVDKVMKLVRKKVSPRFEGVEYTVSERPLVFLNLVDFLYLKVYYIEHPH